MGINQIVTPLDSAVLETKEQYTVYFKIVTHAFEQMLQAMDREKICHAIELSFLQQYCDLITYSLEAFRVKYLYDEDEKMKIDLTESGLPNYLEFRYLYNDLELRKEHIAKLPSKEHLQQEFLTQLLKYKEPIPKRKLQQAASIVYYNSVQRNYIFRKFVQGKIVRIENSETPYVVSWAFYDVTHNRPFVCFMYFDLYKTTVNEYTEAIYEAIEQVADRNMSVEMMAYGIDKKLPKLHPKEVKKIDLGPLHNVFAKDELTLTHILLEAIVKKTVDLHAFAMSLEIASCVSTETVSEGSIFSKQELQVWETQRPSTYVFCPHRVMQLYYDKIPEAMNRLTVPPIEIETLDP
ncbi:hypothetical protein [Altibacter sp. HG106]|uniref:hypothetical protein n=1 Tax=Altibacter sp. HG106 TaxID=3023937 RepID=UPI00234FE3DF|nr:hypothetical protein [Altibacter sp. HG106]MDC7995922.1 hypothetical protein [Altibacter sp. HG106]